MPIPGIQSPYERISGMSFHGRSVHFYPSTYPMPHWTLPTLSFPPTYSRGAIERRDTELPDVVDIFPKCSLGRAICHFHHHEVRDPFLNQGAPTCVNTVLHLHLTPLTR